jgi:Bifunctional DNA primase/polymerase, N-terminal/Protein of unknown function (DUF3987)
MGPFEKHAERLLERGYAVVPIIPGTKKPGFFHNGNWVGLVEWTKRFNGRSSLNSERKSWGRNNTGIGVLAGPASGDLIGVDIDTEDPQIIAALLVVLPPTEVKKAGAKGETRFYHGPSIGSASWSIDGQRVVEIIGPGRQTVLPPTVHPDGAPYRWLGPDTLEDLEPRDLPALPTDIAMQISAILEPFGYRASPQRTVSDTDSGGDDDATPHRRLNEAALANLADWVPFLKLYKARRTPRGYEAVAIWRPSSSGRSDQARTRNLKIVPQGIRDFGASTGYTPLDLTMAALGCDLDAAFAFLADRLGWGTPEVSIGSVGNSGNLVDLAGNGANPTGNGEDDSEDQARADPDPLESYTRVPGVVGDIVDWITTTARRPNRVLALGAAITVVGTLIGRRVAGPTRSATHLYIVTVAPATAGKDHPRRCILPLLEAAHAGTHVHLGDITSQSGFNRAMKDSPLSIVVIDEIAGFLGRITSSKSSYWERRLSGKLREQWSCSFGAIGTMTAADYSDTRVMCPAMSIFGTSTDNEFWSVLQGGEVENGFFSRFLVLSSNRQAPDQDPPGDPLKVPKGLAARLAELYCWGGKPLATAGLNDPGTHFIPHVLPWADERAHNCYRELTQWVERELDNDMSKQAYLGRIAEMAVRLATIRAAGHSGPAARINLLDMEWGAAVAGTAITSMMQQARDCLAPTVRGEFTEKLIQIIRQHGSITRRKLQQRIKGRYRTQEVNDMLTQAIEAGLIVRTPTGYAAGITALGNALGNGGERSPGTGE